MVNLRQELDAIAIGQREIEQHQVKASFGDAGQTFLTAGGGLDGIALELQQGFERFPDSRFIVDD
jgi:hypothetical protein